MRRLTAAARITYKGRNINAMKITKKSLKKTLDEAIAKSKENPDKTLYVWDVKGKPAAYCTETNVENSFTYCYKDDVYLFATVTNGEVAYTNASV